MKNWLLWAAVATAGISGIYVFGQTFGASPSAQTLASCSAKQPPTASTIYFCNVAGDSNPSGLYASANGQPYFLVSPAVASGVTSFNSRKGDVLPAVGDYKYSDLANKPTTISCTTSSQGNSGFTASGCTIQ